jgi:hypothetical protein
MRERLCQGCKKVSATDMVALEDGMHWLCRSCAMEFVDSIYLQEAMGYKPEGLVEGKYEVTILSPKEDGEGKSNNG